MPLVSCIKKQRCKYDHHEAVVGCKGYRRIKRNSEHELQKAVARKGPVAVFIDASHRNFQVCYYYSKLLLIPYA